MLDELFQIIQQSGQGAVVENDQVPNEHNQDVLREAQSAVFGGMSNINNPDDINSLVESVEHGSTRDHPAVKQISDTFIGNIVNKFGINPSTASSIASAIIPLVISKVMGRINQQGGAGSFDLGGLLAGLTSLSPKAGDTVQPDNRTGKLGGIATRLGLDKDGDGDVDLSDLSKMF